MRKIEVSREVLRGLYTDKQLGIPEIAKILGIGKTTVHRKLHNFSIPIRSMPKIKRSEKWTGYCIDCGVETKYTRCKKCSDKKDYQKHKEKRLKSAMLYRKNNPEKVRALMKIVHGKRRALYKEGSLTTKEWKNILLSQDNRCAYCRKKIDKLTIDHIVPLSRGGTHSKENVCGACLTCNLRKSARTPKEWNDVSRCNHGR